MSKKEIVLQVDDLSISFSTDHGRLHAVRGVSFELYKGEILAIVGESGSGKSVSAKTIMGILPRNGRVESGSVLYEGEDLTKISEEEFHRIRGKKIGMIFQDPLSSLNPIMRVGKQITEAIIINGDKLKNMYVDLIAPANIALRNEQTRIRLIIDDNKFKVDMARIEMRKQIVVIRRNKELDKKDANAQIQELRVRQQALGTAHKALVKSTKKEAKARLKELKHNFKLAKKKARTDVNLYKQELREKRKADLKPLREQLKQALNTAEKKEIRTKIRKLKAEHLDQIMITRSTAKEMAIKVMEEVGIPNAPRRYKQFPFEFSGGMRQRIVIAIALIQNPDVLISDEPTTALDVTIQAQILELIMDLKVNRQLSVVFITHDLGVVANMADRVAVMYAGRIVEYGTVEEVFYDPRHPYTWALLSSIPDIDSKERLEAIPGTPPNMVYPPIGDAFAPRSKYAMAIDFKEEPPYFQVSETHFARTWLLDPRAPKATMPKIVSERIKNSLARAGKKNV